MDIPTHPPRGNAPAWVQPLLFQEAGTAPQEGTPTPSFVPVPRRQAHVTGTAYRLYKRIVFLCKHWGVPFVYQKLEDLADYLGLSCRQTQRYLRELREAGWLWTQMIKLSLHLQPRMSCNMSSNVSSNVSPNLSSASYKEEKSEEENNINKAAAAGVAPSSEGLQALLAAGLWADAAARFAGAFPSQLIRAVIAYVDGLPGILNKPAYIRELLEAGPAGRGWTCNDVGEWHPPVPLKGKAEEALAQRAERVRFEQERQRRSNENKADKQDPCWARLSAQVPPALRKRFKD